MEFRDTGDSLELLEDPGFMIQSLSSEQGPHDPWSSGEAFDQDTPFGSGDRKRIGIGYRSGGMQKFPPGKKFGIIQRQ